MKRRAASPTPSEHEVDIVGSLFADESDGDFEVVKKGGEADFDLDFGDLLTAGDGDSNAEDDEDFIATAQRKSNRKSSNVQGKSVKKGGGFQAMGTYSLENQTFHGDRRLTCGSPRPQCEFITSHHKEGLLCPDSNSEEDNPSGPGEKRCCGYGAHRFRKDSRLRHPHDRAFEGTQPQGRRQSLDSLAVS